LNSTTRKWIFRVGYNGEMTRRGDATEPKRPEFPSFAEAVHATFFNREFMSNYRRLTGSKLGLDSRSGIERAIDEATGFDPHEPEWGPFFEFVRDYVWLPVLWKIAEEMREQNGKTSK
jgi:hypothetical protein